MQNIICADRYHLKVRTGTLNVDETLHPCGSGIVIVFIELLLCLYASAIR